MLGNFASKETSFKAKLKDGRTVTLFLRPYSLSDLAWSQENFSSDEDAKAIANLDVDISSKLIWRQLKSESKKIFMDYKYMKEDDSGEDVEYKPEGYERFVEGILNLDSFIDGYHAFTKVMTENGFIPDSNDKKKTLRK